MLGLSETGQAVLMLFICVGYLITGTVYGAVVGATIIFAIVAVFSFIEDYKSLRRL